jgi:hypothetical protein
MNWTSTKVPMWQIDCENFRKVGTPFELRHVTSEDHKAFVAAFAKENTLITSEQGTTVHFESGLRKGRSVEGAQTIRSAWNS